MQNNNNLFYLRQNRLYLYDRVQRNDRVTFTSDLHVTAYEKCLLSPKGLT